jgi:Zn-finger nucleic acid-binding protein/DNA-directed RNA polymerase subunit RPC12/RpoP
MTVLRFLVACASCGRQYDATSREVGSAFRCSCGTRIPVPAPKPHEAAVVRCSSCGAPRLGQAAQCSFCDADFSLREQDLDTICPQCMARTSGRSRFCHHCATPLVPEERADEDTEHACPVCGPSSRLVSRRLGGRSEGAGLPLSVLECGRCGGLWVGREAFRLLADRAQREGVSHRDHARTARGTLQKQPPSSGPLYRPCPLCDKRMLRQNYGRASGVVIDLCHEHGVWCDADELDRILTWLRAGGLEAQREREHGDRLERQREERIKTQLQRDAERELWQAPTLARPRTYEIFDSVVDWLSNALRR